jgi:hypothetical protein
LALVEITAQPHEFFMQGLVVVHGYRLIVGGQIVQVNYLQFLWCKSVDAMVCPNDNPHCTASTKTTMRKKSLPIIRPYSVWVALAALLSLSGVAQAQQNVLQPGDPIVASSSNSPGSEGVANAIDGKPTKYLNFDKLNTGFTVTPSVGRTIITAIALESANDAVERDPTSYTIEGSNDGTNFTMVAQGNVPAFSDRFTWQVFTFTNSGAYTAYRAILLSHPPVIAPGQKGWPTPLTANPPSI